MPAEPHVRLHAGATESATPAAGYVAASDPGQDLRAARGWFLGLAGLVLVLIVWGALVRLTGSGLSIPDWPLAAGSLFPPTSALAWEAAREEYRAEALRAADPAYPPDVPMARFKMMFWIEYLHRTLAAIAGLGFLAATMRVLRRKTVREKAETNLLVLAALLAAQAMMGGAVVKAALPGLLVAVHLVTALVFLGVLVWTGLSLTRPPAAPGGSRSAGLAPVAAVWAAVALAAGQAFLGGLVAGAGNEHLVAEWPRMLGAWLPDLSAAGSPWWQNPVGHQFLHRWMAWVLAGLVWGLWLGTLPLPLPRRARWAAGGAAGLVAGQVGVGILNTLMSAPTALSALHSALGALVFATLVAAAHDLRYESGDVRRGPGR